MRPILMAATLSVTMLLPIAAQAFELDSPSPVGGIGAANFDLDIPGMSQPGMVLERFADQDSKDKQGKLQVFGNDIGGTYGLPNTIPGPANETPTWFYSTPSFRSATR